MEKILESIDEKFAELEAEFDTHLTKLGANLDAIQEKKKAVKEEEETPDEEEKEDSEKVEEEACDGSEEEKVEEEGCSDEEKVEESEEIEIDEADIKDEKGLTAYANKLAGEAFDTVDKKKVDAVVKNAISKSDGDWGAAVGIVQNSFN